LGGQVRGHADHRGHRGRIHRRAEHRTGPHQLIGGGADPAQPGQHHLLQRLGGAPVAGRERAQRLDDEQGVPAGPPHDRLGQLVLAGGGDQPGHRGRRQRAEVEPLGDLGQRVQRRLALLGPDRGQHQQPAPGRPPGQVVQQLDGGQAGVVQVVQHEQGRPVGGQPAQHVGDGVVGPAELELRAAALQRRVPQHRAEIGQQRDERGCLRAGELAQPVGAGRRQRSGERVEEGLQEQRLLAGVAAAAQHRAPGRLDERGQRRGQPGLADTALADHQQHAGRPGAGRAPRSGQPVELDRTPDQVGRFGLWRGPAPRRGQAQLAVRRPVFAQDGQVQRPGLRIRVDAQLGGQLGAQPLVAGQRPGPLAGQLVRRHQEAVRHLVEPIGGHRGLGGLPRHDRVPRGTTSGGRGVPRLPEQPDALAAGPLHPVRVRLAGEHGRGPEHGQRRLGRGRREHRGVLGEQPLGPGHQALGVVQIDPDRRRPAEPVAVPAALDHGAAQHRTQPADQRGDVVARPAGRLGGPEHLDDAVHRHRAPVDREQHQQQPGLAADLAHRLPVPRHTEPTGQLQRDLGHPRSVGPPRRFRPWPERTAMSGSARVGDSVSRSASAR
jgi:hypothetical protein